jgi:amidase
MRLQALPSKQARISFLMFAGVKRSVGDVCIVIARYQSTRIPVNELAGIEDHLNAFCDDSDAYLPGAASGPLSGLRFAAKDIFDVADHVTGGGNPDWKATHESARSTAWVVQALVDAGATMVGKTHTDELTRGLFGENAHYGTPVNPRAPGRVPGGSSSGSAAAVAGGLVDFALGSDTGGSVRMPASFCGLFGMRPTHGRISMDGVLISAPDYDTVGWFARDADLFSRVGAILLQTSIESPSRPERVIIADDAFEAADDEVASVLRPLADAVAAMVTESSRVRLAPSGTAEWPWQQGVLAGRQSLASVQEWIDRVNPRFGFEVAQRFTDAMAWSDADVVEAEAARQLIRTRMSEVLTDGAVLCLPTSPTPAPEMGQSLGERRACRQRILSLTCIAGTTGWPQISLPLAEVDGLPVGLSLIGARGADELLIGFAEEIALRLL